MAQTQIATQEEYGTTDLSQRPLDQQQEIYAFLKCLYNPSITYDLFANVKEYGFGREAEENSERKFITIASEDFHSNEYYGRISRQHFYIYLAPKIDKIKIRPLIIHCVGVNGLKINEVRLAAGQKRILRHGDRISLTSNCHLFQIYYNKPSINILSHNLENDYFVGDVIGHGAQGVVYACYSLKEDLTTGEFNVFALKVIGNKNREFPNKMLINKLMSEVNVMANLKHPHILELIDYQRTPFSIYIMVPFMYGGELLNRIKTSENGRCSEFEAKYMFLQILLGINYMHSKDIAHRDIKCDNILLSDNGPSPILKISDFGLSKTLREQNTLCGTLSYCAPEIIKNEAYTIKVDIWSAGVVLYAMMSGIFPFTETKNFSVSYQIMRGAYSFPDKYFAELSPEAIQIIAKMLQINPENRCSAEELLEDPWIRDPRVNNLLESAYKINNYIEDDQTLTDDIEKTLENVSIVEKSPDVKQPQCKRARFC